MPRLPPAARGGRERPHPRPGGARRRRPLPALPLRRGGEGERPERLDQAVHARGRATGASTTRPRARHAARGVRCRRPRRGAPRHAACVDCHEPHAARPRRPPPAPPRPGRARRDLGGRPVRATRRAGAVRVRGLPQVPRRQREQAAGGRPASGDRSGAPGRDRTCGSMFAASAASFHPVAAPGRSLDVPGPDAPARPRRPVFCGDCHGSDSGPGAGGAGTPGPHGSIYPFLLERHYATRDFSAESPASYALCYKCHDRDVLLSPQSGFRAQPGRTSGPRAGRPRAPPATPPTASPLAARRRRTPTSWTSTPRSWAGPAGVRRYRSLGPRRGSCALTCHGTAHDEATATY